MQSGCGAHGRELGPDECRPQSPWLGCREAQVQGALHQPESRHCEHPGRGWRWGRGARISAGLQPQAGLGALSQPPAPSQPPRAPWRPGPHHCPRSGGRRALSSDGTGSLQRTGEASVQRGKRELLGRGRQHLLRAASSRPIRPEPRPGLWSRVPMQKSRDSRVHDQTPKEVAGGRPGQG